MISSIPLNLNSKKTSKIDNNDKCETLSDLSDDCADMDNEPIKILSEPKPQPIFMKMAKNFSENISTIENSLKLT